MIRRWSLCVASLLALVGIVRADDERPKAKFDALVKEYKEKIADYSKEYESAKTEAERSKILRDKAPKMEHYTPKFLEIAKNSPKDPIAFDALAWVMTNTWGIGKDADSAVTVLIRDHVESPRMAELCEALATFP